MFDTSEPPGTAKPIVESRLKEGLCVTLSIAKSLPKDFLDGLALSELIDQFVQLPNLPFDAPTSSYLLPWRTRMLRFSYRQTASKASRSVV